MAGVNKAIILGRMGKDPEIRYMPNGKAVANISLATSERWTDKQTGDAQERTEWHNVVLFEKTAEIVGEYVRKGDQLYVEGKLQTRKWQDKEGNDRYTTEIVAQNITLVGGGNGGSRDQDREERPAQRQQGRGQSQGQARGGQQQSRGQSQQRRGAAQSQQQTRQPPRGSRADVAGDGDDAPWDDDIPME